MHSMRLFKNRFFVPTCTYYEKNVHTNRPHPTAACAAMAAPTVTSGIGVVSDGMRRLTQLLLISKVCSELAAYLGVADRVLADFVVDLGHVSASTTDFADVLRDPGFPKPSVIGPVTGQTGPDRFRFGPV